jgi:hypothetical protein
MCRHSSHQAANGFPKLSTHIHTSSPLCCIQLAPNGFRNFCSYISFDILVVPPPITGFILETHVDDTMHTLAAEAFRHTFPSCMVLFCHLVAIRNDSAHCPFYPPTNHLSSGTQLGTTFTCTPPATHVDPHVAQVDLCIFSSLRSTSLDQVWAGLCKQVPAGKWRPGRALIVESMFLFPGCENHTSWSGRLHTFGAQLGPPFSTLHSSPDPGCI